MTDQGLRCTQADFVTHSALMKMHVTLLRARLQKYAVHKCEVT